MPEKELETISVLANEVFSYQIAFDFIPDKPQAGNSCDLHFTVESPLKDYITLRTVEYVPVQYACHPWWKKKSRLAKGRRLFLCV